MVKQRRDAIRLIPKIDAIGFASVMLVVLFVLMLPFIVITPDYHQGHDVYMAQVRHPSSKPDADRDDAIVITISRDGNLYFGNDKMETTQLPLTIKIRVNQGSPHVVYFKVDARAKYRYVKDALDGVRASGVEKIVFLVEKQKPPQ